MRYGRVSVGAVSVLLLLTVPPTLAWGGSVGASLSYPAEAFDFANFYSVYQRAFAKAKYIDLTHAISSSTPLWSGFSSMETRAGRAGKAMEGFASVGEEWTYEKHGFQTTGYNLPTDQIGTQLDPPAHWNELGATISDLPATVALRPLVVVDISAQVALNASYHCGVNDVLEWERRFGRVPNGAVVFVRSDWSKGWADYARDGMPAEYPGVELAALKFLHLERNILFHGHEPLDTDMTPNLEGEGWLMHHNFAQAEGVNNLYMVPEHGCLVTIGFARISGGTGGYARYVAVCPPDTPNGVTIAEAPGAPLPTQQYPLRRGADGVLVPTVGATPTKYCTSEIALDCADGKLVD